MHDRMFTLMTVYYWYACDGKDHIHNHLQAKKDETCSEEQVTTIQDEE